MSTHHFHHEPKKEFQLERIILFSDAVFAIAITLLVIEIKVPELPHNQVSNHLLAERLVELIPKFVGLLVSFFVIGIYWVSHHRMFGFVTNYTPRLLWLNLVFLLAVIIMPFSSAFYSEYVGLGVSVPVFFYIANILFLAIMTLLLWEYIANPKHKVAEGITPLMRKYFRYRSIVPPVVFLLMGFVYLLSPMIAVWVPLLIAVVMSVLKKRYSPSFSKSPK